MVSGWRAWTVKGGPPLAGTESALSFCIHGSIQPRQSPTCASTASATCTGPTAITRQLLDSCARASWWRSTVTSSSPSRPRAWGPRDGRGSMVPPRSRRRTSSSTSCRVRPWRRTPPHTATIRIAAPAKTQRSDGKDASESMRCLLWGAIAVSARPRLDSSAFMPGCVGSGPHDNLCRAHGILS